MTESLAIKVTADRTGAIKKTATLKAVPATFLRQADDWAGKTIRYIKQSYKGGRVFKRPPVEIDNRLRHVVNMESKNRGHVVLGTGRAVGFSDSVVYARIQDEGGTVTARRAKALTIPFPGVKGSASQYRGNSFMIPGKGATVGIIFTRQGAGLNRLKPLFLLRRSVRLPARHWFSRPIQERLPQLEKDLSADGVWTAAASKIGPGG
jgi:hypothetical protein